MWTFIVEGAYFNINTQKSDIHLKNYVFVKKDLREHHEETKINTFRKALKNEKKIPAKKKIKHLALCIQYLASVKRDRPNDF